MIDSVDRKGRKVRIILLGNFNYSGIILTENDISITINDKFGKEVSLLKSEIQVLEVSWYDNEINNIRRKDSKHEKKR